MLEAIISRFVSFALSLEYHSMVKRFLVGEQ